MLIIRPPVYDLRNLSNENGHFTQTKILRTNRTVYKYIKKLGHKNESNTITVVILN